MTSWRPLVGFRQICRVILLGVLLTAGVDLARATPAHFVLEIEMANERGGSVQLFYNVGDGYSGRDVAEAALPAGTSLQPLRFELPGKPIIRLRLDPDAGEATVRIGQLRLLTDRGEVLKTFGPECLRPMHRIRSLTRTEGVATVETEADDPMLLVDEPLQAVSQQALGHRTVSRAMLLLLGGLTAGLIILGVITAARSVVDSRTALPTLQEARPQRAPRPWVWFFGSLLVVAGMRLFWLNVYSQPMPVTDEWDADALFLLIPLRGGFLDWTAMFRPHSEHRIFITRLITLVSTILNGEWDPRISMAVGTTLFSTLIALVSTAALQIGRHTGSIAAAAIVACAVLPFDAANLFWGFQSQMFALTLLAVCVILIAAGEPRGWQTGYIAAGAGAISLLTMGSGFVAPALAAGICTWRWISELDRRRALAGVVLSFSALAIVGWLLRSDSRWHAPSYSHTLAEFSRAFVRFGSWPFAPAGACVAVVWAPWLVHTTRLIRHGRRAHSSLEWFAFGLGAWALINIIGLAYSRPYEVVPLDSRFYTALSLSVMASLLSTGVLWQNARARRWTLAPLVLASLAVVLALGNWGLRGFDIARHQLELKQGYDELIRPYLRTGDPKRMEDIDPAKSPYWNSADLAARLDSLLLQPVLPASLRRELALRRSHPFTGSLTPGPLTLAARTLMKLGLAIAALGGLLLVLALRSAACPIASRLMDRATNPRRET